MFLWLMVIFTRPSGAEVFLFHEVALDCKLSVKRTVRPKIRDGSGQTRFSPF